MTHDNNLFLSIDSHLQSDEKPSEYLNKISETEDFKIAPYDLLYKLKQTKQSPHHHPEGNAWNHTVLVVDEAAKVKIKSANPRVLMWAALLHDIGKPDTTRIRKGKVTSYDHDKVGEKLAREFLEVFSEDKDFINAVVALVRWHMQILFVVRDLPFADIKTMKSEVSIHEVALLGLCDRLGRLNVNKAEEKENIDIFIRKCKQFK